MSEAGPASLEMSPSGGRGVSRLLSDDRLARRATRGDRQAFEEIYQRYHQDLYRFCLAMVGNPQDAQDALQETMVKVMRALPGEKRPIKLKPWLYRIAHNQAVEVLRRRRDIVQIESEHTASSFEVAETAEARERLRGLIADLEELPERQRAALVMRELAGLGFGEIGAAFETSPAVARQTIYEARLSLHQMEEGREMSCTTVMRELSNGDGRIIRGRKVSAHLRSCPSCRAFRDSMAERRSDLASIAPLPLAVSAGLLHGLLTGKASAAVGAGAGAAGGAGAGGAGLTGAVGAGAGKAIATSVIVKSAATVAVVAVGISAADRTGLIDVPLPGGTGKSAGGVATPPPRIGTTATEAQQARSGEGGATAGGSERGPGAGGRSQRSESVKSAAAPGQPSARHGHSPPAQRGHARSRATRHGRPEGLPPASSHGQQTATTHKSPQANASPGPTSSPSDKSAAAHRSPSAKHSHRSRKPSRPSKKPSRPKRDRATHTPPPPVEAQPPTSAEPGASGPGATGKTAPEP